MNSKLNRPSLYYWQRDMLIALIICAVFYGATSMNNSQTVLLRFKNNIWSAYTPGIPEDLVNLYRVFIKICVVSSTVCFKPLKKILFGTIVINIINITLTRQYLSIAGLHLTSKRPCWTTRTKDFFLLWELNSIFMHSLREMQRTEGSSCFERHSLFLWTLQSVKVIFLTNFGQEPTWRWHQKLQMW